MIGSNTDYVKLTAFPYTLYGTAYTFLPMAAGPGTVAVVGTAFAAVLLVQFQ